MLRLWDFVLQQVGESESLYINCFISNAICVYVQFMNIYNPSRTHTHTYAHKGRHMPIYIFIHMLFYDFFPIIFCSMNATIAIFNTNRTALTRKTRRSFSRICWTFFSLFLFEFHNVLFPKFSSGIRRKEDVPKHHLIKLSASYQTKMNIPSIIISSALGKIF